MLTRLQEAILRATYLLGPDCRAIDIQERVSVVLGREQIFGSIFTTLDRLEAKGLLIHKRGKPDNRRGGRAPRLYNIQAEGISALNKATKLNEAMKDMGQGGFAPGSAASQGRVA